MSNRVSVESLGAKFQTLDTGMQQNHTASSPGGHPGHGLRTIPIISAGASLEQGGRNHMEDRATIAKNLNAMAPEGSSTDLNIPRSFIAVYDGHSSARGSEHAARRLHHFIAAQSDVWACKGRGDQSEASAMETSLKKAFENVDQEIIATAERHNKRYGTTAVCALVIGSELFVAHAGDSRAVLYRDGAAVQLTRDHKPASVPEERKRIEAQGGEIFNEYVVSNDGLQMVNMSRALGDAGHKYPVRLVEAEPDVAHVLLKPGEDQFLVLGSDGLFDVLSPEDVVRLANRILLKDKHSGLGDDAATSAADALVEEALKRGTTDNTTAAIMLFKWK